MFVLTSLKVYGATVSKPRVAFSKLNFVVLHELRTIVYESIYEHGYKRLSITTRYKSPYDCEIAF